jgi:large conductance mechanosensitive channel
MGFVSEFKTFIRRGNVLDLAIGVIVGGAFGKITASLVDNIFMPPLGLVIGGINFKELKFILREKVGDMPEVAIGYGAFIQSVIDFLIIAFAIFLVIKVVNSMKQKEAAAPAPPPAPSAQEVLLTEIRDLLKK